MKITQSNALRWTKRERQEGFRKEVPPTIVRSLLKIIRYLEQDEEQDYNHTPVTQRKNHVYRDLRRVLAWVARFAGNTFDFPAMLPALGDVVLSLGDPRSLDRGNVKQLLGVNVFDRILDAHKMHHWGEGPDVAAGEGNLQESCAVDEWNGDAETIHYVKVEKSAVEVTVKTKLQATTWVTAKTVEWPESGPDGKHVYLYYDQDLPPENWPWNPRDEQSISKAEPAIPIGSESSTKRPINYHPILSEHFDVWVSDYGCLGCSPAILRQASETAIRTRYPEARIEHPDDVGDGRQPNILTLNLGWPRSLRVHFTLEHQVFTIRGYSWDAVGKMGEPFDYGGYYADDAWSQPVPPPVENQKDDDSKFTKDKAASEDDCCSGPDHFGGCPTCQRNNGYLNVGRYHWFFCDTHQVKWCAGSKLFPSWKFETEADWEKNKKILGDFASVKPVYPMANVNQDEENAFAVTPRQVSDDGQPPK